MTNQTLGNVAEPINLCILWIKHWLFWIVLIILTPFEWLYFWGPNCSPRSRAFIHLLKITEYLNVKPKITEKDFDEPVPNTHYDKMLLLRKKLIRLFDESLHTCHPTLSMDVEKVKIQQVKIFCEASYKGNEKSFIIHTFNEEVAKTQKHKTTVLYFHGGGYLCGETSTYANILSPWLYENNYDCVLVDYTLCPYITPCGILKQGSQAYNYVVHKLRINPKHLVVAGESAGANLSLHVVLETIKEGNIDEVPSSLVLFSPWVDLTLSTKSWKEVGPDVVLTDNMCRLGDKLDIWDQSNSLTFSPLFMDLSYLPPCFVSWGGDERLRDEAEQLTANLKSFDVEVVQDVQKGMFHAFTLFHQYVPEGRNSLLNASRFIEQHQPTCNAQYK
ncbi:esterase [Acrasis kona]|uniref:Esterase n=1 Tax=Acrasis kona TaxID=1008807 RepID=A0AAW2ZHN2_9EUKA